MQALFIVDFDFTVTTQHTHNLLHEAIARGIIPDNDDEAAWSIMQNVEPTGSIQKWRETLKTLLAQKHLIAIASFSIYPQLIQRYLIEKIGLEEKDLQQIFIEAWLPENPFIADKSQHIKNIIKHFNYVGKAENIIFIDDSEYNRLAAKSSNFHIVEVMPGDKSGRHVDAMMMLGEEIGKI